MFGLDNASGVSTMPPITPATSLTPLWFTEGGAGQPPSYPGQDWFNMHQAEHLNVLAEAGIAPDKAKLNQLSAAIKKLIANGMPEIPDASTSNKGKVQLGNEIDSDSETLAATLKAVKAAVTAGAKALGDHCKGANPHNQYLQIKKFLSEIKALGPDALAETLANIGLGEAAKRDIGTGNANVPDIGIADSRYKPIGYLPMLSRVWVSAEYTPVTGTPLVVTHGLAGIDVLHCKADVLLKCVTVDAGYSPGDFAAGWSIHSSANAATVGFPALSTTTIQTNTGAAGTGLLVNGKGGGGSYSAVLANWRYILRIFY